MSANNNKDDLRLKLAKGRNGLLASDKLLLDELICAHIISFCEKLKNADKCLKVACYYPIKSEVDVRSFMREFISSRQGLILLPFMHKDKRIMEFRHWNGDEEALESLKYGVRQPKADAMAYEADVILIPLLGVDDMGYRIGYGGGYYDATIYHLRNLYKLRNMRFDVQLVGIAYELQKIKSFTIEEHDQKMDYLITENGVLEF